MGKKFLVLLLGIVVCSAAFANGNVTGTVYLGPPPAGPAAGATVTLHRNMHPDDSVSTTTDADGHFGFTDIASGMWGAMTFLEGYLPGFGMVNVPWNGGTVDVNLMLGPSLEDAGSVAGVVLRADGTTVAGAHVRLSQMG